MKGQGSNENGTKARPIAQPEWDSTVSPPSPRLVLKPNRTNPTEKTTRVLPPPWRPLALTSPASSSSTSAAVP